MERDLSFARACILGLVLATAALAVAGIIAMFLVDLPAPWPGRLYGLCVIAFAAVALFALGVAQAAAAAAAVLIGRPEKKFRAAFWIATGCAALCGMTSAAGVHLGWAILTDARDALPSPALIDAAGVLLAFTKPLMGFVIQCVEEVGRLEAKDADDARLAAARALDLASAQARVHAAAEAANDSAPLQVARARPSQARAAAKALERAPLRGASREPVAREERVERKPPITEQDLRDVAMAITSEGKVVSIRTAAARMGRSATKVEEAPNRKLIFDAANAALAERMAQAPPPQDAAAEAA